jgi:hypothetical protein
MLEDSARMAVTSSHSAGWVSRMTWRGVYCQRPFSQKRVSFSRMTPSSRAAATVIALIVEPGS